MNGKDVFQNGAVYNGVDQAKLVALHPANGLPAAALRQRLEAHNQSHLLRFWEQLDEDQQLRLHKDLVNIDYDQLETNFAKTKASLDATRNHKTENTLLEPLSSTSCGRVDDSLEELEQLKTKGLSVIAEGKVAVILLAGGQGTRLGSDLPKGMYNVGLPSQKTLYQLQAEKLLRLKQLASSRIDESASIPWYIMTSPSTRLKTSSFFADNDFFGLPHEDVFFFEQGTLPCFDYEGRIILEEKHKVSRAPDGNGGLYRALATSGALEDMVSRGVAYIHVYCVDNILIKMADPAFIGFCISKGADCGAKVVEKTSPHEAVGVICRANEKVKVVEYSEISNVDAERRGDDGRLLFNAGNICNHFFTIDFLQRVVRDFCPALDFHVAQKKIPHVDPSSGLKVKPLKSNGIKLEKFVFDVFPFADKFVTWQVRRQDEFSPLKNADAAGAKDTPSTCRNDLYSLHRKFIEKAGGEIVDINKNYISNGLDCEGKKNGKVDQHEDVLAHLVNTGCFIERPLICEVSPLMSYDGEGLEDLVEGHVFSAPFHLNQVCLKPYLVDYD